MADSHSRTLRALAARAACQLGAARLLVDMALDLAIDGEADTGAFTQLLGAQAAASAAHDLMRQLAAGAQ
jgi:hypothetical protein